MFLSATPQDALRATEITAENTDAAAQAAAAQGSQSDFRAAEIVSQNAAATATASKLPRLLIAGVGLFLVYSLLLKGKT